MNHSPQKLNVSKLVLKRIISRVATEGRDYTEKETQMLNELETELGSDTFTQLLFQLLEDNEFIYQNQ